MGFQVGDVVRLVEDCAYGGSEYGARGTIGRVADTYEDSVACLVDLPDGESYMQRVADLELHDIHTPDDLAMALELAALLERERPDVAYSGWSDALGIAHWLRAEVIAALRGAR